MFCVLLTVVQWNIYSYTCTLICVCDMCKYVRPPSRGVSSHGGLCCTSPAWETDSLLAQYTSVSSDLYLFWMVCSFRFQWDWRHTKIRGARFSTEPSLVKHHGYTGREVLRQLKRKYSGRKGAFSSFLTSPLSYEFTLSLSLQARYVDLHKDVYIPPLWWMYLAQFHSDANIWGTQRKVRIFRSTYAQFRIDSTRIRSTGSDSLPAHGIEYSAIITQRHFPVHIPLERCVFSRLNETICAMIRSFLVA